MSASTDDKDETSTGRRVLLWLAAVIAATPLVLFFLLRFSKPIPSEQVFGAFDGNRASLSVTVVDEPPFQMLIALPKGVALPTDWSGSVLLIAPDGSQWSSHCSTTTMEACNWLQKNPDLDCHILSWKSTPPLNGFLIPHKTYKLSITGNCIFSSPAILVLSGMKYAG